MMAELPCSKITNMAAAHELYVVSTPGISTVGQKPLLLDSMTAQFFHGVLMTDPLTDFCCHEYVTMFVALIGSSFVRLQRQFVRQLKNLSLGLSLFMGPVTTLPGTV